MGGRLMGGQIMPPPHPISHQDPLSRGKALLSQLEEGEEPTLLSPSCVPARSTALEHWSLTAMVNPGTCMRRNGCSRLSRHLAQGHIAPTWGAGIPAGSVCFPSSRFLSPLYPNPLEQPQEISASFGECPEPPANLTPLIWASGGWALLIAQSWPFCPLPPPPRL